MIISPSFTLYPYGAYPILKVSFSKRCRTLHLLFSDMETDSLSARLLMIEIRSSDSIEPVSRFSFSKKIVTPRSSSFLVSSKQSVVFRAKRLRNLVMIRSIFPASQSAIICRSAGRFSLLVPLMPSS